MMKAACVILLCINFLSINFALAQKPVKSKGPRVIIKNEFCPPNEYADDGGVADATPKIVDEMLIEKVFKSFSYQTVYKKLKDDYTITKWKINNQYVEKQIDTLAIISGGKQSDKLVYYIINKSAGASIPGLMNAKINREVIDVMGIKVGMSRKEVEKIMGKKSMDNPLVITNEPQSTYLSIYFINDVVSNMSFNSYSE
jgi:hypothetical protein